MYSRTQETLSHYLTHTHGPGKIVARIIIVLIVLSTLSFGLETLNIPKWLQTGLYWFDLIVGGTFIIEYVARLIEARKKLKFIFSFLGLIDFFVIVSLFLSPGGAYFGWIRIFRVLKILKIIRYSQLVLSFFNAFRNYQDEFKIFLSSFVTVLVIGSYGIYTFEHQANEQFSNILDGLWWAVVTMSTVGYGDIVPITPGGKILTTLVMISGLGAMAILTALVTKVFFDHFFGKQYYQCDQCMFPHHDFDALHCKNCGHAIPKFKAPNKK
jgi:voltage-gated potassium channel